MGVAKQEAINQFFQERLAGSHWLAYRLASLRHYELDFIIDNSRSMDIRDGMKDPETGRKMSRLEEAVYRLEQIAKIVSWIDVKGIRLRTLSKGFKPYIVQTDISPENTEREIRGYLEEVMAKERARSTPLLGALTRSIVEEATTHPRIIYVLNDGMPTCSESSGDGAVRQIRQLLADRPDEQYPICLIACTDDEDSIAWMNEVDDLPSIHVVDDYQAEKKEVLAVQGEAFPFNEGFYLLSTLLGPIDPLFDRADESHVYDRADYEEIVGRRVSDREYRNYCNEAARLQSWCPQCTVL